MGEQNRTCLKIILTEHFVDALNKNDPCVNLFSGLEVCEQTKNLHRLYSLRLFSLVLANKGKKTRRLNAKDLKAYLGVDDNRYRSLGMLRNMVIRPSAVDVNNKTNINLLCYISPCDEEGALFSFEAIQQSELNKYFPQSHNKRKSALRINNTRLVDHGVGGNDMIDHEVINYYA